MVQRGNLAGGQASRSVRCLLCAGETRLHDQLPHIWHQREGSGSYDIRWCDTCELGFLDPRPSANDLARFAVDAQELRRNLAGAHSASCLDRRENQSAHCHNHFPRWGSQHD